MKRLIAFTGSLAALVAAYSLMVVAAIPTVPSNAWAPTGELGEVRAGASATLLPDGRVLIAGGMGESGALATAERYSPDGGTFIAAAPMQSARANHTATLLGSGHVLVVGGTDASGQPLTGAELYDAASNAWLPAGSLNVARRGHTATRLSDGRVLVAGGDAGSALDSIEIFDPETLQFTPAGTLSAPRTQHAAAALLDGRVVIAGGNDGSAALASTDVFDPATNTVSAGPSMATSRSGLTATTLLDGEVLLAGGSDGTVELASAEILDPAGTTFTAPDNGLSVARQNHVALLLPHNNQVLIVGGLAGGSAVISAEYFTPWEGANGAFCAAAICASGYEGPAVPGTARVWAAAAALSVPADTEVRTGPADGLALVAGGSGSTSAELFGFATVKTDKEDYAPGTTVTITGSGWQPGEWVTLVLQEAPALDEHPLELVQADANGDIVSTEFVPDEHDLGIRFYLTAYGAASQAQTTFRDDTNISTATLQIRDAACTTGTSSFAQGQSVCANVTVTGVVGGGGAGSYYIQWLNPSAVIAQTTTKTVPPSAPSTSTDTLLVNTPGTWTVRVCKTAGCTGGGNQVTSQTFTVSASTTLSVSTASGTYGATTGPITATLRKASDNSAISGQVISFALNGGSVGTATTNASGVATLASASLLSPAKINSGTFSSGVSATFAGDSAFSGNSVTNSLTVNKKAIQITATTNTKTYDGDTSAAASPTVTSGSPLVSGDVANFTEVYSSASAGVGNKTLIPSGTVADGNAGNNYTYTFLNVTTGTINPLNVTPDIVANDKTYDGTTAASISGCTVSPVILTDDVGCAAASVAFDSADAGTRTATATGITLTGADAANYALSSTTATDQALIGKADATVSVTGYTGVYDGAAHGATGTATGVGGADLSAGLNLGATFTDVPGGTANWTFSGGTNYNDQSGSVAIVISKADATVSVTGYTGSYDANPHGASGTATGVGGVDLSADLNLGATFTDVPGGTANWTFSGGTNYNDKSGSVAIVINKADATVSVTGYTGVYDGEAHGATGTATGVGGVDLSADLNLGASYTDAPGGTASWTFTGGTNYNDQNGSVAIVIGKADATVSVTGYTGVYDANPHGATGTATGVGGVDLSADLNLGASFTDAPGGTASWTFSGGTNYNDQSGTVAIVINKADATVSVSGYTGTYDAAAHGATGTATGVGGADLSASLNLGATFTDVPGGTANWTFTGGTNYNDQSGTVAIVINKANATVTVTGYTGVYDANPHGASGTATGVGGVDLSADLNLGASFTDVPGGTASWTFSGGTNYNDQSGTVAIVINKADATVSVSGYTGTYDAAAHGATGTATGVGGADLSAGLNLGATFTDVPGGTANWTFTGGTNYNDQSGSVAIVINKANATVTVTGYTGVYDANPHGASGTATGVGGVDLSADLNLGASFTDVPGGTASWTFSGGTNYNDQSGTVAIVINKADATVSVTGYTGVYDANPHGASGTATGVGGADLSAGLNLGATFTDVPGGTANWTFSGGTNYNDKGGSVAIVINKANATVTVTGYTGTYDGVAHGASGTATGVGSVDLSAGLSLGATFTNVPGGTATWTFDGGTNYDDETGSVGIVISKADALVTVNGYSVTYDAAAHTATGSVTGVGGAVLVGLDLSGTTHTDAGSYSDTWSFTDVTGNYNNQSSTVTDTIAKADALVTVNGYTGTYDAATHSATGTATGVGGVDLSAALNLGSSFTDVPGGTANWTFSGGTNYNDQSGSVEIVIDKADATIVVTPYSVTYDGASHTATGSATGIGGAALAGLDLTGTTHSDAGTYTDTWSFTDVTGNYNSATNTVLDVIAKATATITVTGYTGVYDGAAHGATGTATGVGGSPISGLDLGSSFTDVPGGPATWSFENPNYVSQGGTVDIEIAKALAVVNVAGYAGTYSGTAHGATGTATGVGGVDLSAGLHLGDSFTNVPGGTANWTFEGGTNYEDAAGNVAIDISKAVAAITVSGFSGVYDGNPHGVVSSSATGVLGESLTGLSVDVTAYTNVPGGPVAWTFANPNYIDQSGSANVTIAPATAVVTVNGYSGVYDGAPHGATLASAVGVGGANLSASVTMGGQTFINVPGGVATWTFANSNYVAQSGTALITITPANPTIVVTGYSVVFDNVGHVATGTATGVLGEPLSGLNLSATQHTLVGTYTDPWTFVAPNGNYNGAAGTVINSITGWTENGYFAPVDMTPGSTIVWNTVKGGSTVPLKFEIFAGGVEKTTTSAVAGFVVNQVSCSAGFEDPIDTNALATTGGTSLRYDGTSGFFIQNWQTPKAPGRCYQVVMTAQDGSQINRGFFKLK